MRKFQVVKSSVAERGKFVTIAVRGELDALSCSTLDAFLQNIAREGAILVSADCAGLESITSAGIGIFIAFQEKLREVGGRLTLTRATPHVREVFQILGVGDFLSIQDDPV